MRARTLTLLLVLTACDNSDLTADYGKTKSTGGAPGAGGSSAGAGGGGKSGSGATGGSAIGGASGTSAGGKSGAGGTGGGAAGGAGAGGASAGKGGAAGSAGAGGSKAGSAGASGAGGGKAGAAGTGGKAGGAGAAGTSGVGGGSGAGGSSTTGGSSGSGGTGGGAGGSGPEICGNGVVEAGEDCDEASGVPKNGCYPTCQSASPLAIGSYAEATGDVLSPERGYSDDVDLTAPEDYSWVRTNGSSVARAFVLLAPFVNGPISASFLSTLQTGFDDVRASHIKVILHFAYTMTGGADATKAIILQHIQQLAPLLAKNADVIAVMSAGFIGDYGGWYNSSHNLDNPTDELAVLSALFTALPTSRSINVHTPMQKDALYPGGPLVMANAHDGSDKSRTGHADDCFLSSPDDFGTYAAPVSQWEDYVAKDSAFVPVTALSCGVNAPRSDCPNTLAELAAHHVSHLSGQYDAAAVAAWKAQGCYATIGSTLGYRLLVTSGTYTPTVRPGGALGLQLHFLNKGYAAPYNARPFKVVLTNGATRLVADVPGIDVRTLQPGQDTPLNLWFRVPVALAAGSYDVALYFPDESASIAATADYAIRLANATGYNAFTGDNVVASVKVDPSAAGGIDPGATVFAYLPP